MYMLCIREALKNVNRSGTEKIAKQIYYDSVWRGGGAVIK